MKSLHLVILSPFDFVDTVQTSKKSFTIVQDYESIRQPTIVIKYDFFLWAEAANPESIPASLTLPRTFFATIIVYKGMVDETVHGRMCFSRM